MLFRESNGYAPHGVQDFVWVADYIDNRFLTEFDYKTLEKKDFYMIERNMLSKFGLIGQGAKLYFDVNTGTLNLNNSVLNISYSTSEREYHLTGTNLYGLYNDIITYKDAYTDADLNNPRGQFASHIHQFNFGFKKKFKFEDGVEMNLQIIVCLPYNKPAYVEIKVVSNKDLNDGEIYMKVAGRMTERIEAPLSKDYAGICQWAIK